MPSIEVSRSDLQNLIGKKLPNDLEELNDLMFKSSFGQNKLLLAQVAEIPTKKLRNLLAGYITKKIKISKE